MFDNLIGNENAKLLLTRIAASGRVPNAMLFAGPEGVGKKLFAFEFARLLICKEEGCGGCPVCTRIGVLDIPKPEKGDDFDKVFLCDHPDVGMVVPYKRNLRVGAIRELEREAYFRPFESAKRVFIVEDAEKMNDSASNALLKTLEEPPETTHLILITSRPDSLLQTIRSRCQTIRFTPVAAEEVEKFLLDTDKFTPEDASLAAQVTGGSVGRALNLDLEWFRLTRDAMLNVLRSAIVTGDVSKMLQTSEQLSDAKNKDVFEDAIGILQSLVRDVFALRSGAELSKLANSDMADDLAKIAANAQTAVIERWTFEIEELLAGLNVNLNRRMAGDALFVKMAA